MPTTVNTDLFEKMPEKISTFIETQVKTDYLVEENGVITTDLWLEKPHMVSATLYIEEAKPFLSRLDYILPVQDLGANYLLNSTLISDKEGKDMVANIEAKDQELKALMKTHGYVFTASHAVGDGATEYWDMSIPMDTWEADTFLLLWRKLDEVVTFTLDTLHRAGFDF